jgi:predicted esterase
MTWPTLALLASLAAAPPIPWDAEMAAFWKASSAKDLAKAIAGLQRAGAGFDEVYARLQAGRAYASGVETGTLRWAGYVGGSFEAPVEVEVPRDYDPGRRHPVRVYLHGGVARQLPTGRDDPMATRQRLRRRLVSDGQITLFPAGFDEAKWWYANQVENVDRLLDRLKRTYNVDENHVHLMGVSDGGTGAYFFAMRSATAWSAFFPFNGAPGVLANPAMRADGDLYATNLAAKPIYAVNGGRDPLYPIPIVRPYLVLFAAAGANVTFRGLLEAGHDTSWWTAERPRVEAFEASHPRDPLPDRLSWRTERTDRYNRLHWLVIDALGAGRSETAFEDPNTIELEEPVDFGLRVDASTGDPRKVVAVIDGTQAQVMGLRKGDLVLEIDGAPIRTADDIAGAYDRHRAGTPLRFAVERRGQRVQMEVEFPPPPPPPKRGAAFGRSRASGRVDLVRTGNRVEARTAGVTAFTLLLSPAEFDFEQPISVAVNGKPAFAGRVERSVATLLQWAARDNDRTMLFAAQLKIEVP